MSRWIALAVSSCLLAACQYLPFTGDKTGPKYDNAKTLPPLAVPPDLVGAAVKPGYSIPPANHTAAAPVANAASANSPAARGQETPDAGNYALSQRGQAPVMAPDVTTKAPSVAQLTEKGSDSSLQVRMPTSQLWPVIQAALQKKGYRVEKTDETKGTLETAWKDQRTGLSAILGNTVAANARERFIVTVRSDAGEMQNIQLRQIRQESDPEATGEAWSSAPADPRRSVALLQEIKTQIEQGRSRAELPAMTVERLQDQAGPYLVLSVPPAQAQAAVMSSLQALGYQDIRSGKNPGEWMISSERQKNNKGFFSDIGSQLLNGVKGVFGGGDKDEEGAPVQFLLRLSRDAKSAGSVLEVMPVDSKAKGAQEQAASIIQDLADRLNKQA